MRKEVLCRYSDEELRAKGHALAAAIEEQGVVEEKRKAANKQYGDEIKTLLATQKQLSKEIKAGGEMRLVDCEVRLDTPVPGNKQIVRTDTGEVVAELAMEPEDHQGALEFNRLEGMHANEGEKRVCEQCGRDGIYEGGGKWAHADAGSDHDFKPLQTPPNYPASAEGEQPSA